ncbi:GIY-YIG nuclease family protein [Streptomyces lavendulae]|uniref:GIY-YIG nuclease family protein n=1 Tax=Streptomyces lavendulae TaxID=1914 RepID=UPI0033EDA9AB
MYVYVVGPGRLGSPVKIGWSVNPKVRLTQLQVAHPEPLQILYQHPGPRELEGVLHRKFQRFRCNGEWFDFGKADPVPEIEDAASAYTRERSDHLDIRTDRGILRGLWRLHLSSETRAILDQFAAVHDREGVVEVTPEQLGRYFGMALPAVRAAIVDLDRFHLAWRLIPGEYQLNPTYAYRHGEKNYAALVTKMGPILKYRKIET